jgi:hypothetical protein
VAWASLELLHFGLDVRRKNSDVLFLVGLISFAK